MKKALFQKSLANKRVKCLLCPHECELDDGEYGLCLGRVNHDGILYAENYARAVTVAIDPIEKKPLFHFLPGSEILSVATYGCNMRCPFCQNYDISQFKIPTKEMTPEELVDTAVKRGIPSIAFTYNEPTIWYETIFDTARYAEEKGVKIVLVTNGLINETPLAALTKHIDAMNIDLKSFNRDTYRKILFGDLDTVLHTIKYSYSHGVHVEVTNLIVTGLNDTKNEIDNLIHWVASISPDIPLHFSKYFPNFKFDNPPTSPEILEYAYERAIEELHFVYTGNVIGGHENTYCPKCGELLIERNFYSIKSHNLKNGKCPKCGKEIYGIF
ncbi:MAG: AmmeMemoRadiSam system radical SAM enzyme [Proteobacteria bacterium]|nr:AmmeMemoRadiSam system radical SAM enzyme [Pseudomonadota bacterium]